MTPSSVSEQHPIVAAAASVRVALKTVADANPTFMSTEDKATALRELVAAEAQVVELRLRILADAGDLAASTAARDAAGWLAQHTRTRFEDARAELALATALDRQRPVLASAMRAGTTTLAQAHVIRRAIDALPASVSADATEQAEAYLVDRAAEFGPKELGRIGRRILDVVAPEIAEAVEAQRLADLEANAEEKTRLTMRRLGDGSTRISIRTPDTSATRLATYLEAYANPRRERREDVEPGVGTAHDRVARLAYPRRMGKAFIELLEAMDPDRLPRHGGSATTVVVTIPFDRLMSDLAAADVIGGGLVSGDDPTDGRITASQARRLACTAKILPLVLGGAGQPLDLGRGRRLFSSGQQKAMAVRDRTCRAEGCDVPASWCEAHHLRPWSEGGRTDVADGILYCSHHHHRVHDPRFTTERLPNGDTRFHRRR